MHSFGDGREEEYAPAALADSSALRDIYVVRHGSTEMNSEDRIRGHSNPPLSELGQREVRSLGEKLANVGIGIIFCSDLDRAKDTAAAIARYSGAPTYATKLLRPWDLGEFTGRLCDDVQPDIERHVSIEPNRQIKGGESFNQFIARARAGVKFALANSEGRGLALVTHHRIERLIASGGLYDSPDPATMNQNGERPASASRVTLELPALAGGAGAAGASVNGPYKLDWDVK